MWDKETFTNLKYAVIENKLYVNWQEGIHEYRDFVVNCTSEAIKQDGCATVDGMMTYQQNVMWKLVHENKNQHMKLYFKLIESGYILRFMQLGHGYIVVVSFEIDNEEHMFSTSYMSVADTEKLWEYSIKIGYMEREWSDYPYE